MGRALPALLAVCTLTAFAPAPLPRRPRGEVVTISLETCQGRWQLVREEVVMTNGWSERARTSRAIRIEGDKWMSLDNQGQGQGHFTITIDGQARPARIAWYSGSQKFGESKPSWVGFVRRHQGHLQVVYVSPGGPAKDFETLPVGAVILTLNKGG